MRKSIVIHICVAIIRNRKNMTKISVVIVCPGSMATGKYLEAQIKNYFDFHIIGVLAAHEVIQKLEKSEVFYKTFNTFCLDCGTIDFESLCVRTRRTGDTLRLTENGGSRSLKKLMIDRKIPRYMRNAMAVIADKNGVIAVQDIGADCSRTAKNNANTLQITVKGLSKNGL